jgi:hypothetical protein
MSQNGLTINATPTGLPEPTRTKCEKIHKEFLTRHGLMSWPVLIEIEEEAKVSHFERARLTLKVDGVSAPVVTSDTISTLETYLVDDLDRHLENGYNQRPQNNDPNRSR